MERENKMKVERIIHKRNKIESDKEREKDDQEKVEWRRVRENRNNYERNSTQVTERESGGLGRPQADWAQ